MCASGVTAGGALLARAAQCALQGSQALILISLLLPGALSQNTVAVKTLCHSEETQLSLPAAATAAAASSGHNVAFRCHSRFKMYKLDNISFLIHIY